MIIYAKGTLTLHVQGKREKERERERTWGQCPTLGRTMKSSTESKFS